MCDIKSDKSRVCRACLSTKSSCFVLLTSKHWLEQYEYCTDLKVDMKDFSPKSLCKNCAGLLESFTVFKQTCFKSDIFWKSIKDNTAIIGSSSCTTVADQEKKKVDDDITVQPLVKEEDDNENYEDNQSSTEQPENVSYGDQEYAESEKICNRENKKRRERLKLSTKYSNQTLKNFAGQCDLCKKIFLYKGALLSHLKNCGMNGKKVRYYKQPPAPLPKCDTFICGICEALFDNKKHMTEHLKEHAEKNDVKCQICEFSGLDFANMVSHRYMHHPQQFKVDVYCYLCEQKFHRARRLEFHYRGKHLKKKPGLCLKCKSGFSSYKHWAFHEAAHAGVRFQCDHCAKKFVFKNDMIKHMKCHSDKKDFVCHLCGFTCKRSSGLRSHSLRKHIDYQPERCTHCDKIFKNPQTLREHILRVEGEKNVICNVCAKRYRSEKELEKHMIWHSDDKPHRCEMCGNAYKAKSALKIHLRSHTGERPFKCGLCCSAFTTSSLLKRHQTVHTGKKTHECCNCGKFFTEKSHMIKHLLCHKDDPSCS